ncbi:MAG TPA: toll/interleukin-1 receptor domain-containing protein [Anaerolineales bacterium]|jgi:uncharacterized protein YjbI with pentapeptide repeats|nr:toll/interleukin-1 receptor domain-containing protein [Anaerolineales bacterium]
MAIEEHLAVFKQGVDAWNRWRDANPAVPPDLSRVNFWSLETSDPYLMEALWNVWRPERRSYNLKNVNFTSANLRGACLSCADLRGARFNCADLSFADLRLATVDGVQFKEAKLKAVKLGGLHAVRANLSQTDLEYADLSGADLTGADLTHSNLKSVNLTDAVLDGADLSESTMQWGLLANVDLSQVKGLEAVRHWGRSSVGMDTIERSQGRIPESFLQGCGLSALEIEYVKLATPGLEAEQVKAIVESIAQIRFHRGQSGSCFIGFDLQDEEFAQHLHADLQRHGIRCWFVPVHRKFGNPLRPILDRQRRLREKLVVILSEPCLENEWIAEEVEAALQEETDGNRLIVLPVRLDDAVMQSRENWAAHLKRARPIGDFSQWKDTAHYERAFQQLLKVLRGK